MTPRRRLRSSSSSRTTSASRRRIAAGEPSGASAGSIGAPWASIAVLAIASASARVKAAGSPGLAKRRT